MDSTLPLKAEGNQHAGGKPNQNEPSLGKSDLVMDRRAAHTSACCGVG